MEEKKETAYGLSIGTNFNDLEWQWTTVKHLFRAHRYGKELEPHIPGLSWPRVLAFWIGLCIPA